MGDELYAAATSANAVVAEAKFAAQTPQAGRPEKQEGDIDEGEDEESSGGTKLQIANTKESAGEQPAEHKMAVAETAKALPGQLHLQGYQGRFCDGYIQ